MKKVFTLMLIALSLSLGARDMKPYNLTWDSPSKDASGSMPIGNGKVGANVWVEQNGDIVFYISRNDSWSETGELFKLGRVRVSVTPSICSGGDFVQTLDLGKGCIRISGNGTSLDFFIDSDDDVIYLTGKSGNPVDVKVSGEVWRDKEFVITNEMESQYRSISRFDESKVCFKGYPDKIVSGENDITVFHHNCESSYEYTLKVQNINPDNRAEHDVMLNRCFGYSITMDGARKISDLQMQAYATKKIDIKIATLTGKYVGGKGWKEDVKAISENAPSAKAAAKRTAKYWKKFWDKSYIEVQTPDVVTGEKINSAYVLQSWVSACGGRGDFAIKYNGSIFTVDYKYTDPKADYNPDVRKWGGDFWWQNTRLMYYPMLKSGDFEMMKPLFEHYFRNLDVMKANARALCGAEGALSPETQTSFGTFSARDYIFDGVKTPGSNMARNPYIKMHWDSSVEMVALMLDYWDYTGDKEFVKTRLVPYAKEMLTFYNSFYKRGADGRLEITPTQAVETYWYEVMNDTPTVCGLNESVDRLLKLPAELSSDADKALWKDLDACLPAIPVGKVNGKDEFLPAEKFNPKRSNVENPNLYPIFPFHLCNITTDNLQVGINSFYNRIEKRGYGWTQDGQQAARLGLAKEAAEILVSKLDYANKNFRFPVIWGPNFDWTPDQCHGGNFLTNLQDMVLQTYDGVDYILPAFPEDWGVKFKLYSFGGKVVKGHKKI